MSSNKKSFLLYLDNRMLFDAQTDEAAGVLIKALYRYVCDGEELQTDDKMVAMAFSMIRNSIDRDTIKYDEICQKRSEAAKKRHEKQEKKKAEKAAKRTSSQESSSGLATRNSEKTDVSDMFTRVFNGSALGFND